MVIMSVDTYDEKMQRLDIYQKLIAAEKEYERSEDLDAYEALEKLRLKYGL